MRASALLLALPLVVARPLKDAESHSAWLQEFAGLESKFHGSAYSFATNVATMRAHNAANRSWTMGINKFSALTPAEFKSLMKGYKKPSPEMRASRPMADTTRDVSVSSLPTSVDWRTKGVVTQVKDQASCGGCWSFSAAETLESHIAIQTGKLMVFSEQQILDCTPNPDQCGGTGGCNGATQELAFGYVNNSVGISLESSYPYTGSSTFPDCQTNMIKPVAGITGFVALPYNNYTSLMNAVVNVGPIAISAAAEPWQFYESGVFSSPCGTDVDHAIVLEGYGTDSASGQNYYLVRNSWGTGWGEAGYIRVLRQADGQAPPCGTDTTPGDGDGCKGGPAKIEVCGLCGILSDSSYATGGHLVE